MQNMTYGCYEYPSQYRPVKVSSIDVAFNFEGSPFLSVTASTDQVQHFDAAFPRWSPAGSLLTSK